MNTNGFVLHAILFEGAMAIVGALLALICGLDLSKAFHNPDFATMFSQFALGIGLAVGLGILFTVLDYFPWSHLKKVSEKTKEFVNDAFKDSSLFNRFLVCLLAGVGEEILFRGFIFIAIFEFWPWGLEYNLNIIAAIAISSILFGLGHNVSALYFLITAMLGVTFCLVFLWTGSLIAPVIAHALYDFYAMESALKEDAA
ncbi:MAG: CPBP family intramembrane metalloprotease [Thermoguttaceae bacterium]|nr:CPBP family intramembrane metalloprotease [Thermoguttaceae bacterium]